MLFFRLILVAWLTVIAAYTGLVLMAEGFTLFTHFFGDIGAVGWPGQFNMDFMGFLFLSALWVAWRHQFTGRGLLLAPIAFFGGMPFLCIYLLILSHRTGGDLRRILLGDARAMQ